jgi:hypothetical protein
MRFLIGMDDTDNANSGGTGGLAFTLGQLLQQRTGARLLEVTHHQLWRSPLIHHTTQNSCACLVLDGETRLRRVLELECRSFLLHYSAAGANSGMALADLAQVPGVALEWGSLAKRQVLTRKDALSLAERSGISAAGLTGDGSGVIGALAALGLRAGGNDGRYLWLPGLSNLSGTLTLTQLLDRCSIGRVETLRGRTPPFEDRIDLGNWVRPLVRGGRSVLLVEENPNLDQSPWRLLDPARVRQLSE